MPRKYAGIMASLGMTLVMLRAVRTGYGFESAMASALFWMTVLGGVGYLVGFIARSTIDEAVRQQIEKELAAQAANPTT